MLFLPDKCQVLKAILPALLRRLPNNLLSLVWALARPSAFMHIYPCQMLVTEDLCKYSLLLSLALHRSVQLRDSHFSSVIQGQGRSL